MTTRKQSLKTALKNPAIRRALNGLVGCPAGGWGETMQAVRQLADELPIRSPRSYTRDQLIAAALVCDHADRYQWRKVAS